MFLDIFKHLLPDARAWNLSTDKQLRQFFDGLGVAGSDAKTFIDDVYDDIDPAKTTQLSEWEAQFNLPDTGLTDQERRDRLDGAWKLTGGQDPDYLQNTLRDAGFDVYVHEWWEPGTEPAVDVKACTTPRNPLVNLRRSATSITYVAECGEAVAECGEVEAEAGNTDTPAGYPLVNKLTITERDILVLAGESNVQCGEADAICGNYIQFVDTVLDYVVPFDQDKWPYFLYIGGQTFGDLATVDQKRRDEFEALCLKICPAQQWLGIMVNYS
jgi:uncharacterized protein YmfQ (DUF2313 family)